VVLLLLLVWMLTLLAVFWPLLLQVLLMLVFPLAFPLVLQMRCCVLVLVLLTLTVLVPRNLRNRVEKHWMLLCFLHVVFWVRL
jgi:hypothetical protein